MSAETILIFTRKPEQAILDNGGTRSWTLDRAKARKYQYAVLCRNQHHVKSEGDYPHGEGFMVGRVKDVVQAPDRPERWLITFDEYAEISIPNLWPGYRNPINYTTLEALGIDESKLAFKPMPVRTRPTSEPVAPETQAEPMMTIAEAKVRLARTFQVSPDAIEITVRG